VEETFKIRCALECLAAEDALAHLKPKDLRRLKELLKVLKKPVRSEEERRAHEGYNSEFHQILIRASRNRRLIEMYQALNAHIKIARVHASDANWRERLKEEHEEHESIMAAIEAKDEKKLSQALRRHIERAKDALVATLSAKDEVIAR
jgi:DNA-binding GntR family transcriptional regulator